MLSVRNKSTDHRQNILWKRNDPRCIQYEVLTYRQIRLPDNFYQHDVRQQQQLTKDSVDMGDIDGCMKQQLTKEDSSDLDHEAELMVKGFDILQRVTEQKERKTSTASISPPPDISDKELKSGDDIIKPMEQNLTGNNESINNARLITSLEHKLSAMYTQSLHQFDQMSLQMSHLLEEHKATATKFRASKDEVKLLRGRIDLSDMRCNKLESLLCEAMDEHEETKGKFRQQLALGRKRSWAIHDLNEEIAVKNKALSNMERSFSKDKEERLELEKINADAVEELDDCRTELTHKREQCDSLEEQNGMLMKDQIRHAESLMNLNERLDAQQYKSGQFELDVERLSKEKKGLDKKLEQESSAKLELSLKLDKATHAVTSQKSKNRDLAKELATAVSKNDDLQGSLDKVLSEIKNTKKACDREKMLRKNLSDRTVAIVHEKDVELVKVKNKLEATKKFLATVNNKVENKQGFKTRRCTGVGSEKDVTCGNVVDDGKNAVDDGNNVVDDGKNAVDDGKNVVDDGKNAVDDGKNAVLQSEEKKNKRKRRGGRNKKKKGAATDSLETVTSLSSLNKGKSSIIINYI